jgi:hypothetical protein
MVMAKGPAGYIPLEETRIDKIYPPNEIVKGKMDDQTAYNLLHLRASTGRHGRDPVHLILEKLWFVAIAHYVGLQSFESFEVFQDIDPNLVQEGTGYNANHIYRLVLANIARKSRASPVWDVVPNSPDQIDQEAAKVGKQILDFAYQEKGLKGLRRELAYWTELCGTAFIYVDWDERVGRSLRVYKDPFTEETIATNQLKEDEINFLDQFESFEDSREGDWHMEVISPFQVKLPHWFVYFEQMPWVVIERIVPIDWVWEHYPKKARDIQPDEITTNEDNEYWRRLSSLVNRHGFALPSRGGFEYEGVQIREMWIKPYGRFPKGAKIVGTVSRLLENSVHPYHDAGLDIDFPLVDFHHARVPGRYWSMGTVEHLIGPQRDYNVSRTQMIQQRDILCHPQWVAARQAEVTNTRNDYGDLLEYNVMAGGGRPELVQPPSVSQAHVVTSKDALGDMQTIAAQSEPSLGQVPTGVRSGVAIKALQEKDAAVSGPVIEDMEDGMQKVGELTLKLFWKFASVPRAIRIYGESRQVDVQMFKGSQLNGNTAVRVQQGSMMPKSRAATESTMMDLLQVGGINPQLPNDRRMLFEALEVGDMDKIFLEENLQRRRARIENMMFHRPTAGPEAAFPDVDEDDDHQAHYEEHLKFKLTDSFELLPFARKNAFNAHMDKHKLAVAQMMEAQATFQAVAGGGGGNGSPPSQPGQASPTRERQPTPGSESTGEK